MKIKLMIAIYLGTLGLVVYAWWPNIHKAGYVDGGTAYRGWEALWKLFPLLFLVAFTFGLGATILAMAVASSNHNSHVEETEAKHRNREKFIEDRGREIMANAHGQVAEAQKELERATQAAKEAQSREAASEARSIKTREESETAHRNVREQLKRLKQERAKLKAELKAQRMLN